MERWTQTLDGYCERLGPEYWAEPINAVTNLAFLVAAAVMWRRAPFALCRLLSAILGTIGIGSYLFHTHATVWALVTDVLPIGAFILVYIWAANRVFWRLSVLWASLGTAAFVPYAAAAGWLFAQLPGFSISAPYWPVALLIALYAIALRQRAPDVARGLAIGAGLLTLSLIARSADMGVCAALPVGTHFLWHLLNGLMLGWMIEVLRRKLAQDTAQG